jgi:N utilization substance protein A
VNSEFVGVLEELSSDVGIPLDDLVLTVESALASAYKRAFDVEGDVRVRLDPASAGIEVERHVRHEDGSESVEKLPVESFRRLAAQTAREAVLRHIRDLERDKVLREVAGRKGELVTGIVDRIEGGVGYVELGRAEGVMPPEEQIPGERLTPGRPLAVVILEPRRHARHPQVTVSRASRTFVQRLLEAEVPEIAAGSVQVKAIAREAGLRTKVAVASRQPGIDAVGACVGPKGVRHQSLLTELGGEHVDIVPWSDDGAAYVAGALGPARVNHVALDAASRTATVFVPRDQLSLAIGKDGQNARLAAKLTGWRIDIKPDEDG